MPTSSTTRHPQIRPRFRDGTLLPELLGRMESLGRELGLHLLALNLPAASPICPPLMAAGYGVRRTDTWWSATRDPAMEQRFARARQSLARSAGRYPGLAVSALEPGDLHEVNAIVKAHDITDLGATRNGESTAAMEMAHDPLLSTVVRLEGRIAAVQLVRRVRADTVFVHARAVHPDFQAQSGLLNLCFFARFLDPAYRDIQHWTFSARPEVEKETAAMAKRFGALPTDSLTLFGKHLR